MEFPAKQFDDWLERVGIDGNAPRYRFDPEPELDANYYTQAERAHSFQVLREIERAHKLRLKLAVKSTPLPLP